MNVIIAYHAQKLMRHAVLPYDIETSHHIRECAGPIATGSVEVVILLRSVETDTCIEALTA